MTSTAWTYNSALFSTSTASSNTMIVRRLIGDVLVGDQQLQDGEINYAVAQFANLWLAGAECCRWISAQYSRKVDLVQGELKTNYSMQATAYGLRARELTEQGMGRGAGAMPYAGGISASDKGAVVSDPDRVTPQFNIGMQDNLIPTGVGSANETPGNPSGGNGNDGTGPAGSSTP